MTLGTISVGVDRSSVAASALRWAIGLGAGSKATVRAIGTWQMPLVGVLAGPIAGTPTGEVMAAQCQVSLGKSVNDVTTDSTVQQIVVEGKPGPTLLRASQDTDLLVVGRTGHGKRHGIARVAEIVLGSTARHCVHHADIPVVTVPDGSTWTDEATVVVGVDGSASSLRALDWALMNVAADSTLYVVRAFAPWVGDGLTPFDMVNDVGLHDTVRQETQNWVDDAIARCGSELQTPPVVDVSIGRAIDALVDPGYPTDLIVVGARGHTGATARVLGSVSDHLVRYADCPVVVIPHQP